MRNHRRRIRLSRRLALGLVLAVLAAPAAQARNDGGIPALPEATEVRNTDSSALPPGPGVNPRALPREDRAAPADAEPKPDEGLLAWSAQEMALAGALLAATLFGFGLLITIREGRRMLQPSAAPRGENTWPRTRSRPTPAHASRSPREALS